MQDREESCDQDGERLHKRASSNNDCHRSGNRDQRSAYTEDAIPENPIAQVGSAAVCAKSNGPHAAPGRQLLNGLIEARTSKQAIQGSRCE
jgi:hypothetical protein